MAPPATQAAQGPEYAFDVTQMFKLFFKYIFEGIVVSTAAYFIPGRKLDADEIFVLGMVAAAVFAVLDFFSPSVGVHVRNGAGMGIGFNLVGFPGGVPVL